MHLVIIYIYTYNKNFITRKTKTVNNLEWREYPIVKVMKEIIVYVQRQKASKENYTYSNYMHRRVNLQSNVRTNATLIGSLNVS